MRKYLPYLLIPALFAFLIFWRQPAEPFFGADSGALSPGTTADDTSIGTGTWTNTGNITASDNVDATLNGAGGTYTSHYLLATNFGFAIPAGATIDGIVATVEGANGIGSCADNSIRLFLAGAATGDNKSTGATWTSSDTTHTYGASNDIWGATLSATDVNATTFGFGFSCTATNDTGSDFLADHMTMTVYYTEAVTNTQKAAISGGSIQVQGGSIILQ